MRKTGFVIVGLFLPAILLAAFFLIQADRPPAWQQELDKYIEYQKLFLSKTMTADIVERAERPWDFSRQLSGVVFGENPYYQTDQGYRGAGGGGGPRPLPYPPEDIWCVLLTQDPKPAAETTEKATYTVVFVAEHQDLYNASLVVHELAGAHMESLSRVGCDSAYAQVQSAALSP